MKRQLSKALFMRRAIPMVTFFAIFSLATGVGDASSQYLLRHPTREHCRRNYVRDTRTVRIRGRRVRQVWCIHHVSKPAAPKEAPAGSLESLLARTSVAHTSEVLSREVASFVASSNNERAPKPGEQRNWTLTGPKCKTGTEYGAGFIHCEEEAEVHITYRSTLALGAVRQRIYVLPGSVHRRGGRSPQRYLMELFVSGNDGSECGNYSTFVFVGAEWQSTQNSRPRCNVAV